MVLFRTDLNLLPLCSVQLCIACHCVWRATVYGVPLRMAMLTGACCSCSQVGLTVDSTVADLMADSIESGGGEAMMLASARYGCSRSCSLTPHGSCTRSACAAPAQDLRSACAAPAQRLRSAFVFSIFAPPRHFRGPTMALRAGKSGIALLGE